MVTVIEIRSFYSPNFNYLSFLFLLTMARSWQPKVWTLAQIASLQKGNRIYLDQAFQSKARWGTKQKQAFINSCLRGFATGAITLGHIPSLKNYVLLNHGEDHEETQRNIIKNLSEKPPKPNEVITKTLKSEDL